MGTDGENIFDALMTVRVSDGETDMLWRVCAVCMGLLPQDQFKMDVRRDGVVVCMFCKQDLPQPIRPRGPQRRVGARVGPVSNHAV